MEKQEKNYQELAGKSFTLNDKIKSHENQLRVC